MFLTNKVDDARLKCYHPVIMNEKIRTSIANARLLADAAWGAATRRSILRSGLEEYLEKINQEPAPSYNPEEEIILREFIPRISLAIDEKKHSIRSLLTLPWSSQRIELTRLAAALIAFSDDHGRETVPEFFPVAEILRFLHEVRRQSQDTGKQLTLIDQFDIALHQTNNHPVAAAILTHGSYRALRSCDTRLDPRLSFGIDSETESITRMNIARSTAEFSIADTRDPLGNTYHWWSQFSAGMTFALLKEIAPKQANVFNSAFHAGPELTKFIRNKLLGMPLAAGDHRSVDRQGVRLGRALGNVIVNKLHK